MANQNKKKHEGLYEQVFDALPLGLILIDKNRSIYAWNTWMSIYTKISANTAIGQSMQTLYPHLKNPRFEWALDAVLNHRHPQLLSSILNKFIIPIHLEEKAYSDLDMMQQNVEILPFYHGGQNMALIVIKDTTDKIHLKNILLSMAVRFENSSITDALTGLYNRRFLWKQLDNDLKTAGREGHNVVCCLFDLDYFKKINDEFGHSAGDEVLVSFAKLVTSIIRPSDYFVRYGGEEFLVVLTRIEIDDSFKLVNRIRHRLEKTPSHGLLNKKITCSGGLAYWQPSDPPISAEKLVNQADLELYKAKNMGRNRIVAKESWY